MKKRTIMASVLIVVCIMMTACISKNEKRNVDSCELYRIYVGGKCGYMNQNGVIVIDPQFDMAHHFSEDSICFVGMGDRIGLINTNGKFIVELDKKIGWVYRIKKGTALCESIDGKWGIIDKNGVLVLPMIYNSISRDGDYGYIVEDTIGNMGYVDNHGDFIVPCKYDAVNGFYDGLMVVATSSKCGYVDTLGFWVIDTIYDDARGFGDGLARVKNDGKWCFIDHNGNEVQNIKYDDVLTGFANNRAFVKCENSVLLIDKTGKEIKTIEVDSVCGFHEGYATFLHNGKYGKIDTTGIIVIPAKYDGLSDFNDGFARFEVNHKLGLIDTSGRVIIEACHNYDVGKIASETLLYARDTMNEDYQATYYDRQGNVIWRDMPGNKFRWPKNPSKNDFVAYFDSRLSELDPIEGVYYVTFNKMAIDRDNDHASSNGSSSKFYAVIRKPNTDEFTAYAIDENNQWHYWVKKFVQIGESNTYAVMNSGDNTTWAEDGKLILEDPYRFDVTLRQGGNNYYNWYVQCEFTKDYPSNSVYEQVQQAEWSGTGFAIADGYVVTNYHVTKGAKTIIVRGINGDIKEANKGFVVASDKEHDIAIIKIVDKEFDGFEDIPYCIGKSLPEVGDEVFVLGYPLTSTMGQEVKLTDGIISAASGYKGDQSMYQISAAVQPGNSGGPLFDKDGNVIGVICAKHADAENANYAIKVSYLYSLVNSSGLGIKMADNNKVKSKSLSQKVKQVKPFVYLIECRSH